MIGLLIFFGLLPYTLWGYKVTVLLQTSDPRYFQTRLGLLLFIIAAVAWGLVSAGRAYELSGVPDLRVNDSLEYDQGVYRLRLLSVQKDMETVVRLLDVCRTNGHSYLPGRFPLALDWTHASGQSRVHLTAGFEESVSVARKELEQGVFGQLIATGAEGTAEIRMQEGESAYFHLSIEYRKRKPIEKWFRFDKADGTTFDVHLDADPSLKPQEGRGLTKRVE